MPQTANERIDELLTFGPNFTGFRFTNGSYQCEVIGLDTQDDGRTMYRVSYTLPHKGIVAHLWENEATLWQHWKREFAQVILG